MLIGRLTRFVICKKIIRAILKYRNYIFQIQSSLCRSKLTTNDREQGKTVTEKVKNIVKERERGGKNQEGRIYDNEERVYAEICVSECVCVYVSTCVRACVLACVRARVCACVLERECMV